MDWKNIVGKSAPMLATLLGGPAAGAAVSLIAGKLGVAPTEDSVADALLNQPDVGLKLKELEFEEHKHIREMYVSALKLELSDLQDARERHDTSKMPAIITLILLGLVTVYGIALFLMDIPEGNKDLVNYLGGQLIALAVGSVAYWVGTTRSNAFKGGAVQMPMGKGKGA